MEIVIFYTLASTAGTECIWTWRIYFWYQFCTIFRFIHHSTLMLENNSYIRCLFIDFSKAFDVVRHSILLSKISSLNIPPMALNWIIAFLTGRSQFGQRMFNPSLLWATSCIWSTVIIISNKSVHLRSPYNTHTRLAAQLTASKHWSPYSNEETKLNAPAQRQNK